MAGDLLDLGFFDPVSSHSARLLSFVERRSSPGRFSVSLVWSFVSDPGFSVSWLRILLPRFGPWRRGEDEPGPTVPISPRGLGGRDNLGRANRHSALGRPGTSINCGRCIPLESSIPRRDLSSPQVTDRRIVWQSQGNSNADLSLGREGRLKFTSIRGPTAPYAWPRRINSRLNIRDA